MIKMYFKAMEFAFNRRLRADDSSEGILQKEFFLS
jgi:hypothetical protein